MVYFKKKLNLNPYLGIIIFKTKLTHGKPLCIPPRIVRNISTTPCAIFTQRREDFLLEVGN